MMSKHVRFPKWLTVSITLLLTISIVLAGCSGGNGGSSSNTGGQSSGGSSNSGGSPGGSGSGGSNSGGSGPAAPAGDNKYGGTLKIVLSSALNDLGNPWIIRSVQDSVVASTALETLGKHDETGATIPHLAKSWEVDADKLTVTVQLQEGVKFHDGTDFDAEAVKWNLLMFRDNGRAEGAPIGDIEVTGKYSLVIKLNRWANSFVDQLFPFALMISPTAFEKNGGQDWAANNPVGTGPFKFARWEKDVIVEFVKNEDYWQEGKPYLDKIEWHLFADSTTAESSMSTGEYDIYFNASSTTANTLKNQFNVVILENGMGAVGTSMAPDSKKSSSPLSNVNVRKAISYAVDRNAIVNSLSYGYNIASDQWSVPGTWAYNDKVEVYDFNPEKAKQLLAEAGYANGFETTVTYPVSQELTNIYTAVQGYLGNVGIKLNLNPVDNAKWQEMSATGGDWDGFLHSTFRVDNEVVFNLIRNLSKNGTHYRQTALPEDIEELIVAANSAKTLDEKKEIIVQLNGAIFGREMASIPLFIAAPITLKSAKAHDDGLHRTYQSTWTPENAWKEK